MDVLVEKYSALTKMRCGNMGKGLYTTGPCGLASFFETLQDCNQLQQLTIHKLRLFLRHLLFYRDR